MNAFELSSRWFAFSTINSECKVFHTALWFWIVEVNNKLKWKEEFGLPTIDTMECLNIGNKKTYLSALKDIEKWGFIVIITEAKNQYQSCVIKICRVEKATAQPTAKQQHNPRQSNSTTHNIGYDTAPIDKQENKKRKNKKTITPADAVGVEHFNHLKKYFTDFYNLKFSPEEYYHDGKEAAATKNLVKKITFGVTEKCKKRNQVFAPELIPAAIEVFITGAYEYGSTFIRQNFTLNTLYSKYGEVVIQISTQANNMGKSKTGTSTSKVENVINIATAATFQEQQEA